MERLACRSQRRPRFCNRLTDHHAPSAEALEQPARGRDGSVREELAAGVAALPKNAVRFPDRLNRSRMLVIVSCSHVRELLCVNGIAERSEIAWVRKAVDHSMAICT